MKQKSKKAWLLSLISCLGACVVGGGITASAATAADTYYTFGDGTAPNHTYGAYDMTFNGGGYYGLVQTVTVNDEYTTDSSGNQIPVTRQAIVDPTISLNGAKTITLSGVNIQTAADNYVVKIGYYLGNNSNADNVDYKNNYDLNGDGVIDGEDVARLIVTSKGTTETPLNQSATSTELKWNGFDNDHLNAHGANNHRVKYYVNVPSVSLAAGENTLVLTTNIRNCGAALHISSVEIYAADSVYYYGIEKNLGMVDGLNLSVGDRVEAEWGVPEDHRATYYSNTNFSKHTTATKTGKTITTNKVTYDVVTVDSVNATFLSGGYVLGLGSGSQTAEGYSAGAAKMTYTVYAETAGVYDLQVVAAVYDTKTVSQLWEINGIDYTFTWDANERFGTGTADYLSSKKFSVWLDAGANEISFTRGGSSVSVDYFTVLPSDIPTIGEYIEAEDYAYGRIKINAHQSAFSVLSGYATEFHYQSFSQVVVPVYVSAAGTYQLNIIGYAGDTEDADGNVTDIIPNVNLSVNGGEAVNYQVKNTGWLGSGIVTEVVENHISVYLEKGENELVFTKGTSHLTIDRFILTQNWYNTGNSETPATVITPIDANMTADKTKGGAYDKATIYGAYQDVTVDGTFTKQVVVAQSYAINSAGEIIISDINLASSGMYAVKVGYYIGTNKGTANAEKDTYFILTTNNQTADDVSDDTTVNGNVVKWNGFDNDSKGYAKENNRRMKFYDTILNVPLLEGSNTFTITVSNNSAVHFASVEIYRMEEIYYYGIEKNLLHNSQMSQSVKNRLNVGDRIEAEWGYPSDYTDGYYSNAVIEGASAATAVTSNANGGTIYPITNISQSNYSGGYVVGLGSGTGATLNYTVYAEKAGTYDLLITANAHNTDASQTWLINGVDAGVSWSSDAGEVTNNTSYLVSKKFAVTLNEGANTVSFTRNSGAVSIDCFKFIERTDLIDEVIQAEDYAYGRTRITTLEEKYPIVEGNATEFNSTTDSKIILPVTAPTAGYYDFYVRGYTGSASRELVMSVNGETKTVTTGFTYWLSSGRVIPVDNVYRIYLNEGENEIILSRGAEHITIDFFYITPEKISGVNEKGEIVMDTLTNGNLTTFDTQLANDCTLSVKGAKIATVSNGEITAVEGGETTVCVTYTFNGNGYVFNRPYTLKINKVAYTGDDVSADNLTVGYNGETQYYSTVAPDGWTAKYLYNDGILVPNSQEVVVRLIHPLYKTIENTVTFTVEKGVYTGDDLTVQDVKGYYSYVEYTTNLRTWYIEDEHISVPEGSEWTYHIATNGRASVGTTPVKVTFIHPYYQSVEKIANLSVVYAATPYGNSMSLDGFLTLNYYFIVDEGILNDPVARVEFWYGSTCYGFSFLNDPSRNIVRDGYAMGAAKEKGDTWMFSLSVPAKQYKMGFAAKFCSGDEKTFKNANGEFVFPTLDSYATNGVSNINISKAISLSIEQYANYVIDNTTNSFKTVASAMLNYCEAASVVLNDETATEALYTDVTAATLAAYAPEVTNVGDNTFSVSLINEGAMTVRVYCGNENSAEQTNVSAKDLDTVYTFEINGSTVKVSALSWCYQVLQKYEAGDAEITLAQVNAARAVYLYNQAANAYFNA